MVSSEEPFYSLFATHYSPFIRNWNRSVPRPLSASGAAHCVNRRGADQAEREPPVSTTAADVLIECLLEWNVDTVFGIPGDGINGIMEALCIRQDKIRFIQVRHEEGEQGLLRDMPMEPQVVA
jgi:hypothetical protein